MKLVEMVENLVYDIPGDLIAVRGRCFDEDGGDHRFLVRVNGKPWEAEVRFEPRDDLKGLYTANYNPNKIGFHIVIPLRGTPFHQLEVIVQVGENQQTILKKRRIQMKKQWLIRDTLIYNVDSRNIAAGILHIKGWAATTGDIRPQLYIEDAKGQPVAHEISTVNRMDVVHAKNLSPVHETCGFHIKMKADTTQDFYLCISDGSRVEKEKLGSLSVRFETLINRLGIKKTYQYMRQNGVRKMIKKVFVKLLKLDTTQYNQWYKKAKLSKEQLEAQRNTQFAVHPLISFVVPLYQTPEVYLREMIESVQAQTYENWELCLADGSGEGKALWPVVKEYAEKDSRIHYRDLQENKGIAGNTNAALEMAKGDYIALVDHDDLLAPQAAYSVVKAIQDNPGADVFYSDEDKVDMSGKRHFEPNFKPDFNPDMLRSVNYICHLFVMKDTILRKVGGFREEYNGAQDYDMIFRCTENAGQIVHIPQVLYHWRCHINSTAQDPASKMYAFEAGIRAINDHFKRIGVPAHAVHGERYGMYHVIYDWEEKPLVSVLIPNKDHSEDLDIVIRSLMEKCTYRNLEVIVIENNSDKPETWAYYEAVQKKYEQVKVVVWKDIFNYSAINNFGAQYAKGEYLLLLNNDVEVINPDCIEEMLGYAMRPDVGIVGAKLFYQDDTIQHAGVVVGLGGVAGHCFPGVPRDSAGYMGRDLYAQNYSAVTAACLMVRRSVFEQVGGFEEKLRVAFNDVDFCLRVGEAGYKVVYNPYVQLYHYESKSRGFEDTPEKVARFSSEIDFFQERWRNFLSAGDPCYNPNLTLDRNDFSLKNLYHE